MTVAAIPNVKSGSLGIHSELDKNISAKPREYLSLNTVAPVLWRAADRGNMSSAPYFSEGENIPRYK